MKTKLLLFITLFNCIMASSQINVNESFESTVTPSGWIYDSFERSTYIASSGSASLKGTIASATPGSFSTTDYVTNGTQINVSFRARRTSTSVFDLNYLYYSVNNGSWTQLDNFFTTNNSTPWGIFNYSVPAGIITPGSSIKFQIVSNRDSSSGTLEVYFDNFTIQQGLAPLSTVTEYSFDNTLNNLNGNTPFSNNPGTSFVNDRHGNTEGALRLEFTGATASIPYLPIGNTARSVSIWVKPNNIGSQNVVFSYGSLSTNNAYGFSFDANTINNSGYSNDLQSSFVLNNDIWKHVVCTYTDTGMASIYIDGNLITSDSKPAWNTLNTTFRLGYYNTFSGYPDISIDDLKIYNYALTQTEITNLYNYNTLASSNFNQNSLEVALYPNPVHDVLTVETDLELKSIEVYNIHGQKLITANQKQLNVSDLATGIYMVKIEDVDNKIATKKIVVK